MDRNVAKIYIDSSTSRKSIKNTNVVYIRFGTSLMHTQKELYMVLIDLSLTLCMYQININREKKLQQLLSTCHNRIN